METEDQIEFRYADGKVVTRAASAYGPGRLAKGSSLQYDDMSWLMYDRLDRGGVTVHVFAPAETVAAAEASRARTRRRGSG